MLKEPEEIVLIEDVEVFQGIGIGEVTACEADDLVQGAQGVAHASFALLCDDLQGGFLSFDVFFLHNLLEVFDGILVGDPFEVEDLASRQDGREDLVFFRGGEDEYRVVWGLFQGLQECVEGLLCEHVHLIDDVHLVFSGLRDKSNLFDQFAYVFDGIVARRIQFMNIEGASVMERYT